MICTKLSNPAQRIKPLPNSGLIRKKIVKN